MSIAYVIIIVLVLVALACWAIDLAPQLAPTAGLIKLVIVVVAILFIAQRSGLF